MNTLTESGMTALDRIDDLSTIPAWLVQYNRRSAAELVASWDSGEDFEYPAIDRNADSIAQDDLIFFWVSGPSGKAGVIGCGIASGVILPLEHPRSYQDPDGPRSHRDSAEVALAWVGHQPVITREELKRHPAFAEFDLFRMPNRSNAFVVNREQSAVILERLKEVLG